MATRFIKIYVVDDYGRGLSGQRVKTYGGNEQRTDERGCVLLSMDGPTASIYVNGHTAFDGYLSGLGSEAVFNTSGRSV